MLFSLSIVIGYRKLKKAVNQNIDKLYPRKISHLKQENGHPEGYRP
jgi:hypothetical protein